MTITLPTDFRPRSHTSIRSGITRRWAARLALAALAGPAVAVALPVSGAAALTCVAWKSSMYHDRVNDEYVVTANCVSWISTDGQKDSPADRDGSDVPRGPGGGGGKTSCADAATILGDERTKLGLAVDAANKAKIDADLAGATYNTSLGAYTDATTASDIARQAFEAAIGHVENLTASASPLVRQWLEYPNGVQEVEQNNRTTYRSLAPLSPAEQNVRSSIILATKAAQDKWLDYGTLLGEEDTLQRAMMDARDAFESAKQRLADLNSAVSRQQGVVDAAASNAKACP